LEKGVVECLIHRALFIFAGLSVEVDFEGSTPHPDPLPSEGRREWRSLTLILTLLLKGSSK
jgi:hypothetical protein